MGTGIKRISGSVRSEYFEPEKISFNSYFDIDCLTV